ncbi:uncharacterized protein EI90DRAFT_3242825 [Cantharellus anzutake]|uniref:uncharacterized protein n=1 Tax=Cantharellus anzutake TaxID=1750568 RepID=UPI001907BA59|nr:uncharacterized protein EI90DRAFT_3242825 [Cantharellus anzutake]KAF8339910.1 hypothetical protein EI90DRAFT_3242825 [Cantharellus anzutake]
MERDMQATSHEPALSSVGPLKRIRAEEAPSEDNHRPKKARESQTFTDTVSDETPSPSYTAAEKGKQKMIGPADEESTTGTRTVERNAQLVDELVEELSCGCCAGLVYRPVVLQPCQHFFCGSCLTLWIQNSGLNTCPQCRAPSTHAVASRMIQSIVDVFLRNRPDFERAESERVQADEVWQPVAEIKIPQPRPPNPDILLPQSRGHEPGSDNFARPCPHCARHNQFGWRCPRPIPDPEANPAEAWNLDDGPPPGHGLCGACSELHALYAPGSSACSLCRTSFCGLSIPHLCVAPSAVNTLSGLLEQHSEAIWDAFDFNEVEVEVLIDWLRDGRRGSMRGVYQEMIDHVRASGDGFQPMIAAGLFSPEHNNINPLSEAELAQYNRPSQPSSSTSSGSRSTAISFVPLPQSLRQSLDRPNSSGTAPSSSDDERRRVLYEQRMRFAAQVLAERASSGSLDSINSPPSEESPSTDPGSNATGPPAATERVTMEDLRRLFGSDLSPGSISSSSTVSADRSPSELNASPEPMAPSQRNDGNDVGATSAASSGGARSPRLAETPMTSSNEGRSASPSSSDPNSASVSSSSSSRGSVTRICRDCAFEIFLHELYPWWARERKKAIDAAEAEEAAAAALAASSSVRVESQSMGESDDPEDDGDDDDDDEDGESRESGGVGSGGANSGPKIPSWVGARRDCPEGRHCSQQKELSHSKEFNHVIAEPTESPPMNSNSNSATAIPVPPPPAPEPCPMEGAFIDLDISSAEPPNAVSNPHSDSLVDLSAQIDVPSSQVSEMEVDQHLSTNQPPISVSQEADDDNDTIMGEIACPPTGPIIQPTDVRVIGPGLTSHPEVGPVTESSSAPGIFPGPDVMRGPSVEIVNLVESSR